MKASRPLLALASTALLLGACTTRETVAPVTPTTSIDPGTTVPESTVPETTIPETTAPTTTVPETTTTVPPTTTPPPSGTPSSASTQYYAGGDPDGWLYVGRWTGSGWEGSLDDNGQPREVAVEADAMMIHELGIDPIDGNVGATIELCDDGRSGPVISPNARAPEDPGFGYRSLAFAGDWDSEPRPIAVVDADVASYRAAGIAAFDGIGVDADSGEIRQIVVTDLDGDLDSESLVAFGGEDFAALLLIDADSGAAITVSRDYPREPETSDEPPPSDVTTTTVPRPPIDTYRVLAVADLNGDGLAEIVTHVWNDRNEIAEVVVHAYDGAETDAVLSARC
ncbi:hypothetical protein [Ilumatobacter sp.]|uniref:hypothetical protein n=1 Tax=Ilumatobacter sp. TaxID=1967498 RepID=UPI003C6336EA